MSQSVIPIESMTYESYVDGKIRLYRYGKVRILVCSWDGEISPSAKTLVTLDSGDRPEQDMTVSVPGWLVNNRQRMNVSTLGAVAIASNAGTYSDFFFVQITWIVP